MVSADNNWKHTGAVAEYVQEHRKQITARYPSLGFGPIIDEYVSFARDQPSMTEKVLAITSPDVQRGTHYGSLKEFHHVFKAIDGESLPTEEIIPDGCKLPQPDAMAA